MTHSLDHTFHCVFIHSEGSGLHGVQGEGIVDFVLLTIKGLGSKDGEDQVFFVILDRRGLGLDGNLMIITLSFKELKVFIAQ